MFGEYNEFLAALRMRESTDNYSAVNVYNYLGAYQFGEAALIDLGFVSHDGNAYDNNYSGGFTGVMGVNSVQDFLGSPTAQDSAADDWFEIMWGYLVNLGMDSYLGQTVAGIAITASGLLGGAHLLGQGAVQSFLQDPVNNNHADAFGTQISEYIGSFGGYKLPFDTGEVYDNGQQPPPPSGEQALLSCGSANHLSTEKAPASLPGNSESTDLVSQVDEFVFNDDGATAGPSAAFEFDPAAALIQATDPAPLVEDIIDISVPCHALDHYSDVYLEFMF